MNSCVLYDMAQSPLDTHLQDWFQLTRTKAVALLSGSCQGSGVTLGALTLCFGLCKALSAELQDCFCSLQLASDPYCWFICKGKGSLTC
jgi:hypothetical protein